ncbi:hypothetical protein P872_15270 [Rhodonellum psychrophilum GCM71 = DSM 17998]|uniref:Uncharacterized protein n=1 Tax=Rhodonellum psychrophilum GCM71 = DSM 17998 TaxID=1123057 RepID=U5C7E9_9BACT|nr:hypothetical protein P872_15270 [Rhodonellum psychrophilum GCM71 = DSM 17998]
MIFFGFWRNLFKTQFFPILNFSRFGNKLKLVVLMDFQRLDFSL